MCTNLDQTAELSMGRLDQAQTRAEPENNLKLQMSLISSNNCLRIFVQFNAKFCSILLLFTLLYGLQLCNTKLVYIK